MTCDDSQRQQERDKGGGEVTASHPAPRSYQSSHGRRTEINTGPVVLCKKSRVHPSWFSRKSSYCRRQKQQVRAKKTVHLLRCLLYKYGDQSLTLEPTLKKGAWVWGHVSVTPELGRQRQEGP